MPTPKPTATPTPTPTATPAAKPAASTAVTVAGPGSIKRTKAPKVKVWVKSAGKPVAAAGTIEVYRGTKKIKTVKYTKAAKGYATFSLPKYKKGKHTFTFVHKANKDYKKSSKKKTIKFT